MRIKSVFSLLILFTLLSCSKESAPEPQPKEILKELEFDFRYDPVSKEVENYELILLQKDGKILLDTLVATKMNHTFKIKSSDSKFNVSTIVKDLANQYSIKTYVQVNPDKWHLSEASPTSLTNQSEKSKIIYTNIPYDRVFLFGTTHTNNISSSWSNNVQTFNYDRALPTDIAYIVLPNYSKYLFTDLNTAETVDDFENASNTLTYKYNKPVGITNFQTTLYGYPTAGNFKKSILLYLSIFFPNHPYDLHSPQSDVIKEFTLTTRYTDADKAYHIYTYNGPTIPTAIDFAPKADFTVSNSSYAGLKVSFENDKPTTYTIGLESTDTSLSANWHIYSSPDEADFKPKEYLSNINSKLIADKNTADFKLTSIVSRKSKDSTHQSLLEYYSNPTAGSTKRLVQTRMIAKYF